MNSISPNAALYLAIAVYAAAAGLIFVSLLRGAGSRAQRLGTALAAVAFVSHTLFIGTICATTKHPPITNLPEAATFIAWVLMAAEMVLLFRYKVQAAAFFVYPLVVILLVTTAIVTEPFAPLPAARDSSLFIAHLFLTTVGIASLLIALAFGALYQLQDRAIKGKQRGTFYDWIPNLRVCDLVSFRALTIGFAIYSAGIMMGILWSYRIHGGMMALGPKEIGALVAWVVFGVILQSHINGTFRTQKTAVLAVVAFLSILVALLGIQHV